MPCRRLLWEPIVMPEFQMGQLNTGSRTVILVAFGEEIYSACLSFSIPPPPHPRAAVSPPSPQRRQGLGGGGSCSLGRLLQGPWRLWMKSSAELQVIIVIKDQENSSACKCRCSLGFRDRCVRGASAAVC